MEMFHIMKGVDEMGEVDDFSLVVISILGFRRWEEVLPELKISTSFLVKDHDS